MTSTIFDTPLLRMRQNRKNISFKDHDFIYRWTCHQILDRLSVITRGFDNVTHFGARDDCLIKKFKASYSCDLNAQHSPHVIGDEEALPLRFSSQDLIVSTLNLHRMNDVPGALIQIKRALKPDGLFMGAMFGGQTLLSFRESIMEAEMEYHGGVSPRIFPFADKQDCGALMQRAGFALPVIDSETLTVSYSNLTKMLHDLRGMSESNILLERNKKYVGRDFFNKVEEIYRDKTDSDSGYFDAKFEIIFLLGWAPHDTQQKPLKPGSASGRLADFFGTHEIKTGDTP
jgi:NADH dehydrogenase [ubiquinone] 1 alpha subcomplex assembly factor 5